MMFKDDTGVRKPLSEDVFLSVVSSSFQELVPWTR